MNTDCASLPVSNSRGSFKLTLLDKQKLKIPAIHTWSMSIMAINEKSSEIYLSDENKLKVLSYESNFKYSLKHSFTLEDSRNIESKINHLYLNEYKSEVLLILLTQSALVFIFFPDNWERPPLKLDNFSDDFEDCSLWSCCLYDKYLAVGSNAHRIVQWDLETYEQKTVAQHNHNIPCIDINANGYIASTSIDSTVRVTKNSSSLTCRPCTEWGWAVKWISRSAICEATKLPKSNIQNLHNRYKSNLPTTYINETSNIRGELDLNHYGQFYMRLVRRIDGIPSSDSDNSEDDSLVDYGLENCQINSNFPEDLLLQTSKNSVHLIDPALAGANNGKMHILAVYIPNLQVNVGNFSRLSLFSYLEEFSLCVIGNQFGKEVIFLRICKSKNNRSVLGWDYSFVLEFSANLDGKIIGLSVSRFESYARVYVLTEVMSFYVFNLTKLDVEKLSVFMI